MTDRRKLIEGLKSPTPTIDPKLEKEFVFQAKNQSGEGATKSPENSIPTVARSPLSTRIRADYAAALKRASLERQLANLEPYAIQDILELVLEPWLKANGYLPSLTT